MPISFSSPPRNLFLFGSAEGDVVTNFFRAVDKSTTNTEEYIAKAIKYSEYDDQYIIAGKAENTSNVKHGWIEKRRDSGSQTWSVRLDEVSGNDIVLTDIHLDGDGKIIAVGSVATSATDEIPFIVRYTEDGVVEWQSTSNSANVKYYGVTSDTNGNYYACGNTPAASNLSQAFVEKFDAFGNPGWGKSAIILGSDIVLRAIDVDSEGYVIAAGYLEDTDNDYKGYFVKLDTTTGEVIWDRTLEITDRDWGSIPVVQVNDIMIDGNNFIYIVGTQLAAVSGNSAGFICKYSPEGNMLWQKETPLNPANLGRWRYNCVEADTQTGQIVILGSYYEDVSDEYGVLVKYSSDGNKVFSRIIESTETSPPEFGTLTHGKGGMGLDADASFYYVCFTDQDASNALGTPNKYTFGKVSTSGNGLGDFTYDPGDTNTIEYYIQDIDDRIGRLSDGSVRNDTSDLATNILNPTKIMFDDLATPIANKKRQMNRAGDFEYSGSPALRPVDFQDLNIVGQNFVSPKFELTSGETIVLGPQDWSDNLTTANPNNGFNGVEVASRAFDDTINTSAATSATAAGNQIVWTPYQFPAEYGPYTLDILARVTDNNGGWGERLLKVNGVTVFDPAVDPLPTDYINVPDLPEITEVIVERQSGTSGRSRIDTVKVNGTQLIDGQGITLPVQPRTVAKIVDESYKGNDGEVEVLDQLTEPYPGFGSVTFDGSNDYLSMPDSQLLELLDSDFTIEFWIYPTGIPQGTYACIFAKGINVQCYFMNTNSISLFLDDNNSAVPYGVFDNSNLTGTNSVPLNQWSHVAICRDNNTWKAFVNGVQKYSNVIPGLNPVFNSSDDFTIGDYGPSPGTYNFQGYISNFRFVKGSALYVANFTVPTTPLTSTGSDTSLLTCQGDTIVDARTGTPNVITANGGALPSALRISPSLTDEGHWDFNGTSDFITTSFPSDAIAKGDANSEYTLEAWIYVRTSSGTTTSADAIMGHNTNRGVGMQVGVSNGSPRINYGARYTSNFYGPTFNYNEWRHIVLTRDGTDGPIAYENGVEVARNNNNTTLDIQDGHTPGNFNIGYCGPRIAGYFDGKIGEARVYTRALSAQAVFQNYNSTKSKYGVNEAPDIAPKIGPGIVYDSNLLLNYDFGNRATYDRAQNLLESSEDFSSTYWVIQNCNVTDAPDQISPFGTRNVKKLAVNNGTNLAVRLKNFTPFDVSTYTSSIYVKAGEKKAVTLFFDGTQVDPNYSGSGSYYNLVTGVVSGSNADAAGMEDVGGGWWRCWMTNNTTSSGGTHPLTVVPQGDTYVNVNTQSNNGVDGIYIWGAQVEESDTLGRYIRTYESAITAPTKVKNLSSTNFPGTITSATFNSAGYFEFDGTDDYIQSSSVMAPGSADFSVIFWYKITSTSGRGGLFERAAASPFSGWVLGQGGSNNWACSVRDASNNNADFAFTFPTVNEWTCDAFTWNYTTQTLTPYRNGANAGTATNSGTVGSLDGNTRYPMAIAARLDSASQQYKPMECGEVQMYSRVLTAAEVLQNFNATKGKYGL